MITPQLANIGRAATRFSGQYKTAISVFLGTLSGGMAMEAMQHGHLNLGYGIVVAAGAAIIGLHRGATAGSATAMGSIMVGVAVAAAL